METWPPSLPEKEFSELKQHAIQWATMNSLVVKKGGGNDCVHAPFALFPSPFPRECFHFAKELQILFNVLVDRIARAGSFLDQIMSSLSNSDDFVAKIYAIYQKTCGNARQKIIFGIHRSDYMLHYENGSPTIKQVELNTIAASFSSLSQHTSDLHKQSPHTSDIQPENLAANSSGSSFAAAIAKAWTLYNDKNAVVLMVVQPGENNVFDQGWIEQQLWDKFRIPMIKKTLKEIHSLAILEGQDRVLKIDGLAIAVTYFRAGYGPGDYPSQDEWEARLTVERSFTIKCPNAAYHLAGCKKVQQVLCEGDVLKRFMGPKHAELMMKSFTGLYPLDYTSNGISAYHSALLTPSKFVLKPQREGGGNNFYGEDVKTQLLKMTPREREGYILMDLIQPPPLRNTLMRGGISHPSDVLCELGVYGMYIVEGDIVHLNTEGGHLLRTKSSDSNEGGVAAGFAVLDSVLLS